MACGFEFDRQARQCITGVDEDDIDDSIFAEYNCDNVAAQCSRAQGVQSCAQRRVCFDGCSPIHGNSWYDKDDDAIYRAVDSIRRARHDHVESTSDEPFDLKRRREASSDLSDETVLSASSVPIDVALSQKPSFPRVASTASIIDLCGSGVDRHDPLQLAWVQ
jgi:hypothetical protein